MNRHERRTQKKRDNRAQHFVAKGYTRAWCDPAKAPHEEPYVWIFDRDGPTPDKPGKRRAPVNLFSEPEMYTITSASDPQVRDLTLEKILGQIETDFCNVRRDLIEPRKPLSHWDQQVVCAFTAAQQWRTPRARQHLHDQWKPTLDLGNEMLERAKSMTTEQKLEYSRAFNYGDDKDRPGLTMEQVEQIVASPLQTMLGPYVASLVPKLGLLNMSIFCTDTKPGFITSDEPCVWFDPEAHKRPYFFQSPALVYPSLEVTLPLSPRSMLLLSSRPYPQYIDLDRFDPFEAMVTELNRRTCRYASKTVVVSKNEFRKAWADVGKPPPEAESVAGDDEGEAA